MRPRRRKGGEGDLFDGLPLAPPGFPELICRWCGGPKIPRQRCPVCNSDRDNRDPLVRLKIENWRKRKIRECTRRWSRVHNAKNLRWAKVRKRNLQVMELDRLIERLFNCFERDRRGDWQLYADRLNECQEALNEIEIILPMIRKLYKYERLEGI